MRVNSVHQSHKPNLRHKHSNSSLLPVSLTQSPMTFRKNVRNELLYPHIKKVLTKLQQLLKKKSDNGRKEDGTSE